MTKHNIWVISDTHFNHTNILNFKDSKSGKPIRPMFGDVREMNEVMIQRWNESVRPGDIVYHVGDVFFGDKEQFKAMWPRLMGSKRLIVGNHDDIAFLCAGGFFKKVSETRLFKEHRLILSHRPLHESQMDIGPPGNTTKVMNVHGHIHQNKSPKGPYYNVSVENTDYRPIHIEDLAKIARSKL